MTRTRALGVCLLFFMLLVPVCHMAEGAAPTEGSGAGQEVTESVETPEEAFDKLCEAVDYALIRVSKTVPAIGEAATIEAVRARTLPMAEVPQALQDIEIRGMVRTTTLGVLDALLTMARLRACDPSLMPRPLRPGDAGKP